MKIGKKGISNVIATVLMLLLTIVAVVIISTFVIPLVKENLTQSTECLNYRGYFIFNEDFDFNCWDGENYNFTVETKSVEVNVGAGVSGFNLVLSGGGSSDVIEIEEGSIINGLSMLNGSSIIEIPAPGEMRTYGYNPAGKVYEKMSLNVRLKSGRVCEEKSDSINLVGAIC